MNVILSTNLPFEDPVSKQHYESPSPANCHDGVNGLHTRATLYINIFT